MRRVEIHLASTGGTFTERRPEELRAEAEGGAGSMSALVRTDLVAQAAEAARAADPMPRLQHALARLHIPVEEAPADYGRRFIRTEVVDGEVQETCILCGKTASHAHLLSDGHRRKLDDQALGDLLAGQAQSTRNRTMGVVNQGMYRLPTQANALDFWGESLTNLVPAGLGILRRSSGVRVDIGLHGRGGRQLVPPDLIRTAELALLKYSGQGKYFRNDFWYWHDLPTDLGVLSLPAGDVPAPPDAADAQRPPAPARGRPRPHSTMRRMEDGEGWWPVLVLTLEPGLAWMTPWSELRVVLVICFYQLLGSEHSAWWLEIPSWD